MYLARVQDQLTITSPKATVWSCVSVLGAETPVISKQFAHRGTPSLVLCARVAASPRNPEDRH